MNYIEALRKKGSEAVEAIKWPRQEARIFRQFEKKIDELVEQEDSVADAILELETQFLAAPEYNMPELINQGLRLMADLDAARGNSAVAQAWLEKLRSKEDSLK